MIVHPARALTRLIALILLPVLGLVSAAFAVAAIVGGNTARDLADASQLTAGWREVTGFLGGTASDGGTTVLVAAGGTLLVGLILLVGALAPARERELALKGDADLTIRRRALRTAASTLAGRPAGTTSTKVRLRTRRLRRGGRLRVEASRSPNVPSAPVKQSLSERIAPLASAFALRAKTTSRVGKSRKRRIA